MNEHPALVPVHLLDPHGRAFTDADPGVEQKQDQCVIPAALERCAVKRAEQAGDVPLLDREPDLLLLLGERNAAEDFALDHVETQAPGEEGSNLAVATVLIAGRGSPAAERAEELVDVWHVVLPERLWEAELPPELAKVLERLGVAANRARRLPLDLDRDQVLCGCSGRSAP